MPGSGQPHVAFGVTSPVSAKAFLVGQLPFLADHGFDVTLLCAEKGDIRQWARSQRAAFRPIRIRRGYSVSDLRAFADLIRALRETRPDCVVMGTPKMATLGLLASRVVRVPNRTYLVHGLRYEGATGWPRRLLQLIEKFNAGNATAVVAVSHSVKQRLADDLGVSAIVLGHGSANGIDTDRFHPATPGERRDARLAFELAEGPDDVVIGFLGRLTHDKGVRELAALAGQLAATNQGRLLVAGDVEARDPDDEAVIRSLLANPVVRYLGPIQDPQTFYAAIDFLVLPTWREGLPTVVLEAAACAKPTVATRATGVVDAIDDGISGLITVRDDFVAEAIRLCKERDERIRLGCGARALAIDRYSHQEACREWGTHLGHLVRAACHPRESHRAALR